MAIDMSNLSITEAKQVKMLTDRGWETKHGMWSHPEKLYQGLRYFYTFEQAVAHEEINDRKKAQDVFESSLKSDPNVSDKFKDAMKGRR